MVSLPAGSDSAEVAAGDGSGSHLWRRTGTIRSVEGLELRVYVYAGPSVS
ncbi:MAG TPA: hypothetical protein VL551_21355 [Actinospica sp.]|nr:hypothetical protein [Actinospica sp.]